MIAAVAYVIVAKVIIDRVLGKRSKGSSGDGWFDADNDHHGADHDGGHDGSGDGGDN